MPRNGSGVFTAPSNNWNPPVAGQDMDATDWQETLDDLESALSASIASDGQTTASARIPFAAGVSSMLGAVTGVSYSFTSDPNTGIYSPAADKVGIVAGGTEQLRIESALVAPIANNTVDLGSSTNKFKDGYFAGNLTVAGTISGSFTVADGSITAVKLASDAVTTVKILDSNVTAGKLAADAVTTVKILDANVTTAKILDSNVTTAKIADSNVTTAKIADSNVTTAKIADNNVTLAKLATQSANTFLANASGSAAVPSAVALSASQLAGRGASGDIAAISLGTNLSMSGTTLNSSGGGTFSSGSLSGSSTTITTAITSSINRIIVCADNSAGTGVTALRLGDSGGIESTGYLGGYSADGAATTLATTGFDAHGGANNTSCFWELIRVGTSDRWVCNWKSYDATGSDTVAFGTGAKSTSAATDRLAIVGSTMSGTYSVSLLSA